MRNGTLYMSLLYKRIRNFSLFHWCYLFYELYELYMSWRIVNIFTCPIVIFYDSSELLWESSLSCILWFLIVLWVTLLKLRLCWSFTFWYNLLLRINISVKIFVPSLVWLFNHLWTICKLQLIPKNTGFILLTDYMDKNVVIRKKWNGFIFP